MLRSERVVKAALLPTVTLTKDKIRRVRYAKAPS